jgi:hypothetical protein
MLGSFLGDKSARCYLNYPLVTRMGNELDANCKVILLQIQERLDTGADSLCSLSNHSLTIQAVHF